MKLSKVIKPYAYKARNGTTYYLHTTIITRKTGDRAIIYHFNRNIDLDTAIEHIPAGYEVFERKGFSPKLRKIKNKKDNYFNEE